MTHATTPHPDSLAGCIADLDENGALHLVRQRSADGESPLAIIQDCQDGMRLVGERYQIGTYFISGLIMAGEIFREAVEMLAPLLPETPDEGHTGSVLICTVQGDIHDLGKNIVTMLLRSHGIRVHDLGVDVAPEEVVGRALELRPDVVGLSGLLTAAASGMKHTVAALGEASAQLGGHLPVIIGGGPVDEQICKWTGADLWADDAVRGALLIREAIAAQRH